MKATSRLLLLFLFSLSVTAKAFQQEPRTLKGIVTDENNLPLTGVSIMVKGTTKAVTTDAEGKYSITVDGTSVILQASHQQPGPGAVRQ